MERKKTGRFVHEAAAVHAETLVKILDNYEVDKAEVRKRLKQISNWFAPSNIPNLDSPQTKSVPMKITDDLHGNLVREMKFKSIFDKSFPVVGTYSPVSLEFENACLFLPSAVRFYKMNKDTVREHMPEVNTVTVNAFCVPAQKHAFGFHNAGGVGIELEDFAKKGWAFPKQHWSFHTALTPTPLNRQPLCIWDDLPAECANLAFYYEQLRSFDMTDEERDSIDKCYYLCAANKITGFDVSGARGYLQCKYYEKAYASPEKHNSGYYWDLKPGEAVFFDNYKFHGDSRLPLSEHDRVTIDLRCYSKVKYPPGMMSGLDMLQGEHRKKKIKDKHNALDIVLRAVGYRDIDEFLTLIYGVGSDKLNIFDVTTDLQYGIFNSTEHFLLEQNLDPHYERMQKLYEQIERDGEFIMPQKTQDEIIRMASN